MIAASQGHTTLDAIQDEHVEQIRRAHLLLAMFNAWQPGVFALSGWDLARRAARAGRPGGRADRHRRHPLDRPRRARPDGRRPRGHALGRRGCRADARCTGRCPSSWPPRARSCAASARCCRPGRPTTSRSRPRSTCPPSRTPGCSCMVHRLDGGDATLEDATVQVTVLNFTGEPIEGSVRSEAFTPRLAVTDATTGAEIGWVDDLQIVRGLARPVRRPVPHPRRGGAGRQRRPRGHRRPLSRPRPLGRTRT